MNKRFHSDGANNNDNDNDNKDNGIDYSLSIPVPKNVETLSIPVDV